MSATLITGSSQIERLEQAKKRATKLSKGVDLVILSNPTKIEEVRQIIATLSRRPYESKAISIILDEADSLTVEAQNALLKTLEEPPGETQIFLLTSKPEKLLSTIRSRCQVLDLGPAELQISPAELRSAWKLYQGASLSQLFDVAADANPAVWAELIRQLMLYQLGGRRLLDKSGSPVKLTDWLEEKELDQEVAKLNLPALQKFLATAQQVSQDLEANINHRLAMENLFLALPRA